MNDPWWKDNEWCTNRECEYKKCIHHMRNFPKELEDQEYVEEDMEFTDKCVFRFATWGKKSRENYEREKRKNNQAE